MSHAHRSRPSMVRTDDDPVAPFLGALLNTERFGGRCVRRDANAWEVLDVGQWTETHADAVAHRFPALSVRILANSKSLSGFSIVLVAARGPSDAWVSLVVCAVMAAAMCGLTRVVTSGGL